MPPRKAKQPKEPQVPVRRSGRLGGGSSRASSVVSTDNQFKNHVQDEVHNSRIFKNKPKRQNKKASPQLFDVAAIIEGLLGGNQIIPLTHLQKDAVISGFVDEHHTLQARIADLERERDEAIRRSQEKPSLRDLFFREALIKAAAAANNQSSHSDSAMTENAADGQDTTTQPETQQSTAMMRLDNANIPDQNDGITETDSEFDPSLADSSRTLIPRTPGYALAAATSAYSTESAQKATTSSTQQQPSMMRRLFSTFTSPFTRFRTSPPAPPQLNTPTHPLGELPNNRKRRASEIEPEPEQEPQSQPEPQPEPEPAPAVTYTTATPRANKTPRTFTSTAKRAIPASLTTITERSEPTDESVVLAEPTPSRAPRSIIQTRKALREKHRMSTPQRAWTPKPAPREPNADARVEKLRQFRELSSKVEALKEDAELQSMIARPVKRVKIDDLVSIPHNRPGDPEGCFRVYEVDSDDEMTVDIDAEVRSNIFDSSQIETPAAPTPAPPAPAPPISALPTPAPPTPAPPASKKRISPSATPVTQAKKVTVEEIVEQTEEIPPMTFNFPSVGKVYEEQTTEEESRILGLKFAYGLAKWQATGELIEW